MRGLGLGNKMCKKVLTRRTKIVKDHKKVSNVGVALEYEGVEWG